MVLVGGWSSAMTSEQSQDSASRLGMDALHRYFDGKGTSVKLDVSQVSRQRVVGFAFAVRI
jgi:hypothetical protein